MKGIIKKSVFILTSTIMLGVVNAFAVEPVDLSVGIYKPIPKPTKPGKAPVDIPSLWQEGYELTFQSSHPEYTVELLQDGVVVYSVEVSEGTTIITLPSCLLGSYEIELQTDSNYYFYGIINLGIII